MYQLKDKVVVVTGAASGIGAALAKQLAAKGAKLALSDVDQEGLQKIASSLHVPVMTQVFDVADRAAFETFAKDVKAEFGPTDVIINNAGVALLQPVQDMQYDDMDWLMKINFWGVVHGVHAVLPDMLERNEGVIVNVSSLFGLMGWPANSAYCASKFAVRGYTETMRHDLQDTKLQIHCVHPGGIKTNIVVNSRFTADDMGQTDKSKTSRDFAKAAMTSAGEAASIIISGIEKNKPRIVVGKDAKFMDWLQRRMPAKHRKVIDRVQGFVLKRVS